MPRPRDGVEVRHGTDADIPAVIELMRLALGEGQIPRTLEFWTWKHRSNPFGPSPLWVAESAGRLVGARLFLRWNWRSGKQLTRAVRAVDTSTHPEYQGTGIFKRLTLALVGEMTDEGVGFVFNTPNGKSLPGYLKMGWQAAGRVPLWILPRRPLRLAWQRLAATPASDSVSPAAPDRELDNLLRELPDDWSGSSGSAGYETPVDLRYLRWRYATCPAASYRAAAREPRRAFVVYRERQREGARELTFCDLFFERTLRGAREAIGAVKKALTQSPSDYAIAALRPDAAEAAVLMACGFIPAPRTGPILTVRRLAGPGSLPDPMKLRHWHASIGDLELF